jgi:GT2 family glycosyltransferase
MPTELNYDVIAVEETEEPAPIDGALYISHPVQDNGISYARNLALQHASGEIVVFIDDDCQIHEKWLDQLVAPFNDEKVVGVQGGVTVPEGSNAIGWAESMLGFPGGGIRRILDAQDTNQETVEISTLNCAYRKGVIDKVGGFDESLKFGGEDYLLSKQASRYGRCLFGPKAIVGHAVRGNLIKIWRWFVRRGRAEIGVIRTGKYKKANFWSLMKSSLLIKIVALLIAGLIISGIFIFLIPAALVVYLGLQYLRYFKTWQTVKLPLSSLAVLPLVKLIMDLAADSGRLKGWIFD